MKKNIAILALAVLACTNLETPVPVSPEDGETVYTSNPLLIWQKVPEVRSYLVQISGSVDFSESIDTVVFEDTSVVILDSLELGSNYYWRVSARNAQGAESEPSAMLRFKVSEGVELLSPSPQDSTAWPEFTWKAFPGASSYELSISRLPDFKELVKDTTLTTTAYKPQDSLFPATYYWRVQGFSGGNEVSSPSLARRLVTYLLKESYFPLHSGYSVLFEYTEGSGIRDHFNNVDTTSWKQETIPLKVETSYTQGGRLYFEFSDTLLWDVGDIAGIESDSLFTSSLILGELYPRKGSLFCNWHDSALTVSFISDTLHLERKVGSPGGLYDSVSILRRPALGTVFEMHYKERIKTDSLFDWNVYIIRLLP